MLAYKVNKEYSEIMMTHGGNSLDKWLPNLRDIRHRIDFAADMLRQTIMALKTIHGIGYSHCDLKLQNICVREDVKGRLKFTLIDFGISKKLYTPGVNSEMMKFNMGNLMFCSDQQLKNFRPTQFCDLISAVCVAYYIVNQQMPITKLINEAVQANPSINAKEPGFYSRMRMTYMQRLEKDISCRVKNPFHVLHKYLIAKRDFTLLKQKNKEK